METIKNHGRGGVAAEQVKRLQGGGGADRFGQVAAAGAEGMGDAAAQLVDAGGDKLQPGARGADHAYGAAAHGVGKAEARAVDDGGAAVRAHHEQPLLGGGALEGDLVLEAHVVAVEKDMAAEVKTLVGDAGGKTAGDGDQQPAGVGGQVGGGLDAARAKVGRVARLAGEQGIHLGQGGVRGSAIGGAHGDNQVVGAGGCSGRRQQIALGENVLVSRCAHHDPGVLDPGEGHQPALKLHEDYRIVISSGSDLHANHGLAFMHRNRRRLAAPGKKWANQSAASEGREWAAPRTIRRRVLAIAKEWAEF